jgi:copper chaperone NosL
MTIVQKGFGCELVTNKGKVYRFDSIECLAAFVLKNKQLKDNTHSLWVTDFNHPGQLVDLSSAFFVHSNILKSPMGAGLVALKDSATAINMRDLYKGELVSWEKVVEQVGNTWDLH